MADIIYFMILLVFFVLNIFMMLANIPILTILTGIFSLGAVALALTTGHTTDVPVYPMPHLMVSVIAVVAMYHGGTHKN